MNSFLDDPLRAEWDHVGRLDEATMTTNIVQTKKNVFQLVILVTRVVWPGLGR